VPAVDTVLSNTHVRVKSGGSTRAVFIFSHGARAQGRPRDLLTCAMPHLGGRFKSATRDGVWTSPRQFAHVRVFLVANKTPPPPPPPTVMIKNPVVYIQHVYNEEIFDVALYLLKRHSGIVWDPGRFAELLRRGDVRRLGNPSCAPALGLTP